MKYVSDENKVQSTMGNPALKFQYGKNGEPKEGPGLVFAEETLSASGGVYLVQTYASALYDPYGANANRESKLDLKMQKVSHDVFKEYLTYLKTRNLKYLTLAQRRFISDRG
jgi:hypothetical protein